MSDSKFIRNSTQIRKAIKDTYGRLYCEYCRNFQAFTYEAHHIIFRSEKPGHKNLHDKRNILILCGKCHEKFHAEKRIRNGYIIKRNLIELFDGDRSLYGLDELLILDNGKTT